jgi:1-aminocyclopropane-1-carboxylate deaminase/D-cysteine desulfhydrase-like pyridoxal-dependent ACC family enzyme
VYVPLGTGGSAVGLAIGLRAAGLDTRVVAVRTASHRYGTPRDLEKMRRETIRLLQEHDPNFPDVALDRLEVREGFVGRGYAEPTDAGKAARSLVHETAGLELDLTYSAKAFAALVKDAPSLSGQVVVFWLTYDARPVEIGGSRAEDLPRELRGYAR